jgi:hypothetical protein
MTDEKIEELLGGPLYAKRIREELLKNPSKVKD